MGGSLEAHVGQQFRAIGTCVPELGAPLRATGGHVQG